MRNAHLLTAGLAQANAVIASFSIREFRSMQRSLCATVQKFCRKRPSRLETKCQYQYLTLDEIVRLLACIDSLRDYALLLLTYRHGARISEAIALKRTDVDLDAATIH